MLKSVAYSSLAGTVQAPPSKSMMQRAIAAALLCSGQTVILNPGWSDDCQSALRVAQQLGAKISLEENRIIVNGGLNPQAELLDCGESGLCIRSFAPIAALYNSQLTLTGHGSLLKRPVDMIEQALIQLGAECETNQGLLPLKLKGPLRGGNATIDGSLSSQLLTGLLLALPLSPEDSCLTVLNLQSRPYIDLTLDLLQAFGIIIEQQNYEKFIIKGRQQYQSCNYLIEGDWSGAAFLLVAAAVSGAVTVEKLCGDSLQGDRAILTAIASAGAEISVSTNQITVQKRELKGFSFDATQCPDLFPPLVALAAACNSVSTLRGVKRLKHKESDRGAVLMQEFKKIGVQIEIEEDLMRVYPSTITGGSIDAHNDHRIAMAAAVIGTYATQPVHICGWQAINKSYPDFFTDLSSIGGKVQ